MASWHRAQTATPRPRCVKRVIETGLVSCPPLASCASGHPRVQALLKTRSATASCASGHPRVHALLKTRSATASCASGHPHASSSACADGHPSVGKRPPLRAPPATLFFLQTGRFADQRVGSGACCGTRASKGKSCARARSAPRAQARAVPVGAADAVAGSRSSRCTCWRCSRACAANGSPGASLRLGGCMTCERSSACYAELGMLRRLAAAGRAGGTVVTSIRQLVAGLAPLHPAWRIERGGGVGGSRSSSPRCTPSP